MSLTGFDLSRFSPSTKEDGTADDRTAAWFQAVRAGFHDDVPTPEKLTGMVAHGVKDGRVFTAVHPSDPVEAAGLDGERRPVATFSTLTKSVNLGGGTLVDAHLITSITVRPTYRRRGILRELITTDLAAAAERGMPVALLTATEATIYRRFGFGKVAFTRAIRVDLGERFGLLAEPAGRVEVVTATWLAPRIGAVFEAFHARTVGSIHRQSGYSEYPFDADVANGVADKAVRAAVHVDENGELDGYVTFKAKEDKDVVTLEILDLVAATPDAYLGLWKYLGDVDLASIATFGFAPIDDPLTWALRDSRVVTTTSLDDAIWARILDPVAAFQARAWASDGAITVRVDDALGHAEGTFRFVVTDGRATVTKLDESDTAALPAEITLDASTLGSLLLGAVRPTTLARAGDLTAANPSVLARADALFAAVDSVYCITYF